MAKEPGEPKNEQEGLTKQELIDKLDILLNDDTSNEWDFRDHFPAKGTEGEQETFKEGYKKQKDFLDAEIKKYDGEYKKLTGESYADGKRKFVELPPKTDGTESTEKF